MPKAPICPFFIRARNEHLTCAVDGADAEAGGILQMEFPTKSCRVRYWKHHCCGAWESCPLSAALWEEYERAEAERASAQGRSGRARKARRDKPA